MTRGCAVPNCQQTPAAKSKCCGQRLCETHAATSAAHSCPTQARLLAMTPAEIRQWKREHEHEEVLTTQALDALNLLPGLRMRRTKRRQGARKSDDQDGVLDLAGHAAPDGIAVYVEMKKNHPDDCRCSSCTDQRDFAAQAKADGCVVVLGCRTVQAAVDGVRMGLARARGPKAHDRVRCLRCGHVWESRPASGQIPKQCGLCLSPSAGENGETMIVAVARDAERSAG